MAKKKEANTEENFEKIIKAKIAREIRKCFFDKEIMSVLLDNQMECIQGNYAKLWNLTEKKFKKMEKILKSMEKTNEINGETMTNVLFAIQQNEFFQAYYPAQQGYPAMKVTGSHPIQTSRRQKCK